MTIEELQTKIKNLEGYNKTLSVFQLKIQSAIYKTEMEIRKTCSHDILKYVVGYESIWDSDGNAQGYHCKYCERCNTLFVIRAMKYGEGELEEPQMRTDLRDNLCFNTKIYIDWNTMKDIL